MSQAAVIDPIATAEIDLAELALGNVARWGMNSQH